MSFICKRQLSVCKVCLVHTITMFNDSMFYLMLCSQEQLGCDSTTTDDFLFEEDKVGRLFIYKYMATNTPMCLGVAGDCDESLSLVKNTNFHDRRCKFSILTQRSR